MTDRRGVALVLLIFGTLLLMMLGGALLSIAISDFRVSLHLAEAERAFYSAEAGVEAALAALPREHGEIQVYSGELSQSEEPVFHVVTEPLAGEDYALRIASEGRAGSKARKVEALARYLPLGNNGVIAGSLRLERVWVKGGVVTETLLVGPGESRVSGILSYREKLSSEGAMVCGDHLCLDDSIAFPEVDFTVLEEAAAGWAVPAAENGAYRFTEESVGGYYFVPGDLTVEGGLFTDAMVVVSGNVRITALPAGRLVLLARGEVVFACGGEEEALEDGRELTVYSGVCIRSGEAGAVWLRGALLAPAVELRDVKLIYSDRAVIPHLDSMPGELLLFSPSFAVEWVDPEVRR